MILVHSEKSYIDSVTCSSNDRHGDMPKSPWHVATVHSETIWDSRRNTMKVESIHDIEANDDASIHSHGTRSFPGRESTSTIVQDPNEHLDSQVASDAMV